MQDGARAEPADRFAAADAALLPATSRYALRCPRSPSSRYELPRSRVSKACRRPKRSPPPPRRAFARLMRSPARADPRMPRSRAQKLFVPSS